VNKNIAKAWVFKSDSNPNITYETLSYDDGTTSCGCKGWTRRVAADGSRSCKHTRLVDMGLADQHCVSTVAYNSTLSTTTNKKVTTQKQKFEQQEQLGKRKIQW
jgi:hypothetical protein